MIDYIALSIGHGILAIAFLRMFLRDGLDVDPLLERLRQAEDERRKSRSRTGRARKERARTGREKAGPQSTNKRDDTAAQADG